MLALVPEALCFHPAAAILAGITGLPGFQLSGIAIPPGVIGRGVVTQSIGDRFDESGAFTSPGSRSTTSFMTLVIANRSLPSARTGHAVRDASLGKSHRLVERGETEMAHPLFWQQNTTGSFRLAAKLAASWKSPSLVAPIAQRM